LFDAITAMGYERCTPVQEQTFPESLLGHDVAVQAQTGTGKTAVFLVTALQRMLLAGDQGGSLRVMVLVPTRELAVQVERQAVELCKNLHYRSIAIFGGVGYDEQERALSSGAEIVVATPGRLIDFVKSRKIDLSTLGFFIIDEADRMFDMGFMEDVKYILRFAPPKEKRQTIIVSATLDDRIRHLAYSYMSQPVEIEIEPDQITVELVEQKLFHVSREEKLPLLLTLLKREEMPRVIIFTNMKRTAEELGFKLCGNGVDAEVLTGDIDQKKRLKIIDRMKDGSLRILVATDVAARGLHINDVSHVINYDLPGDAANYVHRIGRTARAGATGKAYTLACEDLVINLPPIERYIEQKIEVTHIDFELERDNADPLPRRRGRPFGGGDRPRGDRPQGGRPFGDRPRGDRPQSGRPFGDRPQGDRPPAGGSRGGRPQERTSQPSRPHHAEGRAEGKRGELPADGARRRPSHARPQGAPRSDMPKPSKQMSAEDRMEVYRKKYGDSFGGKGASPDAGSEHKRAAGNAPRSHHAAKPHHAKPHAHGDHAKSVKKEVHGKHEKHEKHGKPEKKEPKKGGILGRIYRAFKK